MCMCTAAGLSHVLRHWHRVLRTWLWAAQARQSLCLPGGNACVPGGHDGRQAQAHRWHRVVAAAEQRETGKFSASEQKHNKQPSNKGGPPQSDKQARHLQAQRPDPPRWGETECSNELYIHQSPTRKVRRSEAPIPRQGEQQGFRQA